MSLLVIILLVVILFGGLGGGYWGYRGGYYGPNAYGGLGLVVILLIVLLLFSGIWRLAGTVVSRLLAGDCRDVLATLAADSVQCVVTSPPYYALRSYLHASHPDKHREIGLEATPAE